MSENTVGIHFILNGVKREIRVSPSRTLLEMLRRDFSLNAVKEGCGKGECGACTVLLNGRPINSCLKPAATLTPEDQVVTMEGLESDSLMKKVQTAYVDEGGVQCGFCTPGMVMSTYALLKNHKKPTEEEIKEGLSGNLCRCTGYTKILQAVKVAAGEGEEQ
jgi:aerobic carbon-monoxide dehydrogenase small subunit